MSDRYVPTPVGFARVNREPLDKYDTFNDLRDLIAYTKTGPAYDGQICSVASKYTGDIINYIINKTKNNNYKLTPLYNIDHHIVNTNSIDQFSYLEGFDMSNYRGNNNIGSIGNAKNKWLLIHSFIGSDSNNIFNTNRGLCDEYGKFSIMDSLELYRDNNNKFTFILTVNGSIVYAWYQYLNPLTGFTNNSSAKYIINNKTEFDIDAINRYNLFPDNDGVNSISLYVSIDDYLAL